MHSYPVHSYPICVFIPYLCFPVVLESNTLRPVTYHPFNPCHQSSFPFDRCRHLFPDSRKFALFLQIQWQVNIHIDKFWNNYPPPTSFPAQAQLSSISGNVEGIIGWRPSPSELSTLLGKSSILLTFKASGCAKWTVGGDVAQGEVTRTNLPTKPARSLLLVNSRDPCQLEETRRLFHFTS